MVTEKIKQEFNENKQDLVGYIMYYFRNKWDEKINGGKRIDNGKMIRLRDTTHEDVGIAIDRSIELQFCEHYDIKLQVEHRELIEMIDELLTVLLKRFTLDDINIDNRISKEREVNKWVKEYTRFYIRVLLKIK